MELRTERYKRLITRTSPLALDGWVRGLLIHYFFHISDRANVEVVIDPTNPARRSINLYTPTLLKGPGRIRIAATAVFGVQRSPGSYSCSYVEARTADSSIDVGDGTVLNNRAVIVSEGASVRIGKRCLIGFDVHILDSNNHRLELAHRHRPDDAPQAVLIEDDVFIGSRATLLKGCRIGRGSVIAASTLVPPGFEAPPMSIVAGNPARIVGMVKPE